MPDEGSQKFNVRAKINNWNSAKPRCRCTNCLSDFIMRTAIEASTVLFADSSALGKFSDGNRKRIKQINNMNGCASKLYECTPKWRKIHEKSMQWYNCTSYDGLRITTQAVLKRWLTGLYGESVRLCRNESGINFIPHLRTKKVQICVQFVIDVDNKCGNSIESPYCSQMRPDTVLKLW